MNSSPQRPYGPRTPSHGHGGAPRGFSRSSLPHGSLTPSTRPYSSSPGHPQYPPPLMPNFPPPWSASFSPLPPPPSQYFTPPHLPYSPLSSSSTPLIPGGTHGNYRGQRSSPASFYMHPDMPSPMMPPQKRKRFTPIRGRGRGRQQHNRSFRGGRGRGRETVGIDAYYDRFMFEDPWRDLLSPAEETPDEEESVNLTVESQDAVDINSEVAGSSVSAIDEPIMAENRTSHETSPPCPNSEEDPIT